MYGQLLKGCPQIFMSQQNKFERTLSNPFFKYMNRIFWLFVVNFVFCLVSVLSLFVLFVPGLVSLHTIAFKMVHDDCDKNPVIIFFLEIKEQWSFSDEVLKRYGIIE